MGKKKKKKPGVLKTKSRGFMPTRDQLAIRLQFSIDRSILYRDVMMDTIARLTAEKRLVPANEISLKIQIGTMNAVIVDCLRISAEEGHLSRVNRDKEKYEEEVTKMMNKVAPRIEMPGHKKVGRIFMPS